MELTFTDDNFDQDVLKAEGVVVIDFWAPWCGPCVMVSPVIEEIANELSGKAKVGKMNVDENPQTQMKYSIMSIPTVLVIKGGEVVETLIGVQDKNTYMESIQKHL